MPYKIVRHSNGTYSLVNSVTGRVLSKGTTLDKVHAQMRAIYARSPEPLRGTPKNRKWV
jgi:hypothetical protein